MNDEVARRLLVRGRVQGVFFRAGTREQAEQAGVRGWIANRADGTVEAWLEGPPAAVAQVERWIRAGGPPQAQVDEVDATDVASTGGEAGFTVRG